MENRGLPWIDCLPVRLPSLTYLLQLLGGGEEMLCVDSFALDRVIDRLLSV